MLILLVCIYGYAVHGRAHYDEADTVLAASAEHIASELATANSRDDSLSVVGTSLLLGSAIRVYGSRGQLLLQSPNRSEVFPKSPVGVASESSFPRPFLSRLAPSLHRAGHTAGTFRLVPGAVRWRVYALAASDGYIEAIAPLDTIDASVRRFGSFMIMIAFIGSGITFLAGWVVAGYALRPVALLTQTAADIAASRQFSRRVSVDGLSAQRDELGKLAATFNEMLVSLENGYSAQQRFVSDASHELRAPLTAIQANLELLRDRKEMSPAERDVAVSEAATEAGRLSRLVSDLLALARADAGIQIKQDEIELDRIVMDVTGEARHLVRGQRLEIEALEPAEIQGDADRIKQLLLILVDNAIRYTPPNGTVKLSLVKVNRNVVFTVSDSGIGIPREALPRVFERFYRAEQARSRDPDGTGLGLSIAQWIAEEHGGIINLASGPGIGTVAAVSIPIHSRYPCKGFPDHRQREPRLPHLVPLGYTATSSRNGSSTPFRQTE